eukprot:gene6034-12163_t
MIYAAIEGGGTTWVVAIAKDRPDNIIEREEFATESPQKTIGNIRSWLKERKFDALGIATFGPIDAKLDSKTFGFITSTPKPGWTNTDVLGILGVNDFKVPYKFDTDVNAPALAEFLLHNQLGASSCAYITVGTGVGVGLVVNGSTIHGLLHPEAGHIQVARMDNDRFEGVCPFHKNCIEGMCGSGALAARRGVTASQLATLDDNDPVWDACAYQLAQLCVQLILIASPERIVIGGGVLKRSCLYPKIRAYTQKILNSYIQNDNILTSKIDQYIGPSYWGNDAGIVGAAFLAQVALEQEQQSLKKTIEDEKESSADNLSLVVGISGSAGLIIVGAVLGWMLSSSFNKK